MQPTPSALSQNMKQNLHLSLIILVSAFLLLSYSISARPLPQTQDEKEVKADGVAHISTSKEITTEDFMGLMGLESDQTENCDEECLNRRMIAEAHLDYIYTQNHKP